MSGKVKFVSFLISLWVILLSPTFSYAASEIGIYDSDISVETIPSNPQPYEDVTIKLTSFATDLNKANIQWKNGSNTLLTGYGKTSYIFKAQGANNPVTFDVTIAVEGGVDKITKRIIINPSEIDILWEAVDGYVPPFYKGKSFPSAEGTIKAVAFPQTRSGSKTNITYTWKSESDVVLDASGYSKDTYIFKNSALSSKEKVGVTASSVDNSYNATTSIDIPIVKPQIIFYKKIPGEGIHYAQAVFNNEYMAENEMTIVAEPYFLALKGNENDFTYTWTINGNKIRTPSKKTELTVRPSERGGYATINVVMENLNAFYQKVTGILRINL